MIGKNRLRDKFTVRFRDCHIEVDREFQTSDHCYIVLGKRSSCPFPDRPYFTGSWDGESRYWLQGNYDLSLGEALKNRRERSEKPPIKSPRCHIFQFIKQPVSNRQIKRLDKKGRGMHSATLEERELKKQSEKRIQKSLFQLFQSLALSKRKITYTGIMEKLNEDGVKSLSKKNNYVWTYQTIWTFLNKYGTGIGDPFVWKHGSKHSLGKWRDLIIPHTTSQKRQKRIRKGRAQKAKTDMIQKALAELFDSLALSGRKITYQGIMEKLNEQGIKSISQKNNYVWTYETIWIHLNRYAPDKWFECIISHSRSRLHQGKHLLSHPDKPFDKLLHSRAPSTQKK